MLIKTQCYADQSDAGEARVSGSNSDADGHAPIFMQEARILSMIG
ncbi:hypothetical protein [Candidatus Thiodiazotropha endoloripes]|nr:hypothetical protein [Candidatus Thiodiazotropha endoloripes]MCW4185338.1 hypothetical protein [Candidatus Thiodiazotropha weberae]